MHGFSGPGPRPGGSLFGLRPKSVTVDFSEKFTGRFQVAFKGGAYVLLMPASDVAEKSFASDHMKAMFRNFIFDAAHQGSDDDKQKLFSSLEFHVHAGYLREKCALVVPPGWVCAMATPESQEGSLVGASAPFFDVSLESCKTIRALAPCLTGAASAAYDSLLQFMPEEVLSKLKDEEAAATPPLEGAGPGGEDDAAASGEKEGSEAATQAAANAEAQAIEKAKDEKGDIEAES